MSKPALVREIDVRKTLKSIYGTWHQCKMGTYNNPLLPEDRARGLKKGQLCDTCENMINAHLRDMREKVSG